MVGQRYEELRNEKTTKKRLTSYESTLELHAWVEKMRVGGDV